VAVLRAHGHALGAIAATLRTTPDRAAELVAEHEAERKQLQKATRALDGAGGVDVEALLAGVEQISGVPVLAAQVTVADAKALPEVADRLKGKLGGDGVLVLGAAVGERAALLVSVAPSVVQQGVKAGAIVKLAAALVGGGGGGRDTMAQAGGRDPSKLADALIAARVAIAEALGA
jgi:alanyl-tRNA synthetase